MVESWASSENARRTMRANRRRDTEPELAIRRLLHARGLRYRVDHRPLRAVRRHADIVFTRIRLAVFVDGCFWHGCPEHFIMPKANRDYWSAKIEANRVRDRDTDATLEASGWTVLRVWEHEDPKAAADRIERTVRTLTPAPSPRAPRSGARGGRSTGSGPSKPEPEP